MKTWAVIGVSVVSVAAIGGVGAYYYYKKELQLLKNFKYKVTYFNIGDVSADVTTCYLTVRVFNDSTLSAEIIDFSLDLFVDNKKLGVLEKSDTPNVIAGVYTDKTKGKLIIPAKGYSDAALKVKFSPKLVLGAAWQIATRFITGKDFDIDLKGHVMGRSGFISATADMNYHTTFKEILKT